MADTATLLPRLRPFGDKSQEVYYPVLVPNMRGLENLLKLEDENEKAGKPRLTNEIAIFVAASDVSHLDIRIVTNTDFIGFLQSQQWCDRRQSLGRTASCRR